MSSMMVTRDSVSYTHLDVYKRQVHLLPQEQINFGFMNGYGGILYKRSYDTNATKNHIELI